jgi:hypothetical protein
VLVRLEEELAAAPPAEPIAPILDGLVDAASHAPVAEVPAAVTAIVAVAPARDARAGDGWPRYQFSHHGPKHLNGKGITDTEVDFFRLSTNSGGHHDLRAHCSRCGQEANRTYKEPDGKPNGQGRPIGRLCAWLRYDCGGERAKHKKYNPDLLTRVAARIWLGGFPDAQWLFKERPVNIDIDGEPHGEPYKLP